MLQDRDKILLSVIIVVKVMSENEKVIRGFLILTGFILTNIFLCIIFG